MSDETVIDVEVEEVETTRLPAVIDDQQRAVLVRGEMTVDDLLETRSKIQDAVSRVMKENEHFGAIPGAGKKKVLLKGGAELLNVLFRLAPSYQHEMIWHDDGHLTVVTDCTLTHAPTEMVIATGSGLCSTREAKYAYRQGQRVCPDCGQPQVREGKARNGRPGNWYCWQKQGGCGSTWDLDSEQGEKFRAMETGRVPNPDLADTYNTVLKMADKRALVAATLNGTAASDFFTQDLEDERTEERQVTERVRDPEPAKVPRSWADCETLMAAYGEQTLEAFKRFGKAAKDAIDGGVKLGPATLFQATAMVVSSICDQYDPSAFPPPLDAEFAREWAKHLDGLVLAPPVEPQPDPPAATGEAEGGEGIVVDADVVARDAAATEF